MLRELSSDECNLVGGGDGDANEIVVKATRIKLDSHHYGYTSDANGDGRITVVAFSDGFFYDDFNGFFTPDRNGSRIFQDTAYSFSFNFRGAEGEIGATPQGTERYTRVGADSED